MLAGIAVEVLLRHALRVRNVGEVNIQRTLSKIAAPDHILDRCDQERRARNDQAFIGIGEQLALRLAAAFADDADRVT